jgi:murein DD-endopeptidase MepM/ murein hydrolase activator NlpD
MASKAQSFVDVVLGEAVHGSPVQRYEDMKAIASAVVNRANALGVSIKDVISAKGQFDAFGKSLPPGVEAVRSLAEKAVAEVMKFGPTHAGTFYATPSATKNLPSGLQPVTKTAGHVFFDDPQNRAIATARGYKTPSIENAAYNAPSAKTAPVSQNPFDALFGSTVAAPSSAASATIGALDDGATWDGAFSSPLGSVTGRVTSDFGLRSAPNTSLGVGSANHPGMDFAERGQSGFAANAAGPGIVTYAGPAKGYGNMVTVEHPNGFTSRYGHLQDINVSIGDEIARGTPIGTVGSTGKSTGPHLHFEMRDPLGQPVNPRDVVDFTRRDLAATPTSRPMSPTEQRNAATAYGNMAASMANAGVLGVGRTAPSSGLPAGFDTARFAGDVMPSRPSGAPSPTSSQMAAFAGTQPSRSMAPASMPSPERFGYAPAAASPAKAGGLGGLGGIAAKAAPDPARFGPAQMTSTPTTGRLSSTVNASNSTPMAAAQTQALSSPLSQAFAEAGIPTSRTSTVSVAPSTMGLLPSTSMAPAGPFSSFTAMPTDFNAMTDMKNTMKARPLSMPTMPTIPSVVPPAVKTPTVQPMVTPVAKQPVSPQTTASIPTPRPSFSAFDVYSGKAPVGYQAPATGGNVVSRDQFGNTHVTNSFGVTTVTDPSGRQMGNLSGLGKGIGNAFDKAMDHVTPGMIGSVVGGAIAGMPGAIVGGLVGNKMGGQQSGQKSGGLGGLGGFLSGLFGGGNSGNGGGGSSGSRGGGSSGSRGGPAGADRDHAGNG